MGWKNSTVEGTGIGLTICKHLMESMNGAIGFDSGEGEGSTFWVELPTLPWDSTNDALQRPTLARFEATTRSP